MLEFIRTLLIGIPFMLACLAFGLALRSAASDFHTVECIAWQHCVWNTPFMIWWFTKVVIAVVSLLVILLLPPELTWRPLYVPEFV